MSKNAYNRDELLRELRRPVCLDRRQNCVKEAVEAYTTLCRRLKELPAPSQTTLPAEVIRELRITRDGMDSLGIALARLIESTNYKEPVS